MLFDIDHRLGGELLHVMRSMGHGDEIVIADAAFASESIAAHNHHGKPIDMFGYSSIELLEMILKYLPLDHAVPAPVFRFAMKGDPQKIPPIHAEAQKIIDAARFGPWKTEALPGPDFYERSRKAYALVRTSELRFFGCYILRKGTIDLSR